MPLPLHPVARAVAESILADPKKETLLIEWANLYRVSTRTIARAFEAQTGHGFASWRKQTRLLAALPMLMDGQPVHRVGVQVGYGTVGGFITAFAQEFGETPAVYVRDRRRDISST
ncbi:helix-turn-helix transcriptional regulator [Brevibacterium aurantiacum]